MIFDTLTDHVAVVVSITEREYVGFATDRILSTPGSLSSAWVVVPLCAPTDRIAPFADWPNKYDLSLDVLWCDGLRTTDLLDPHSLDGKWSKSRDMRLTFGCAARKEYVVVHDAYTKTYDECYIPWLLPPLAYGHDFSEGYYARAKEERFHDRLFRLFYAPFVHALEAEADAPIV